MTKNQQNGKFIIKDNRIPLKIQNQRDILALLLLGITIFVVTASFSGSGLNFITENRKYWVPVVALFSGAYSASQVPPGRTTLNLPRYWIRGIIALLCLFSLIFAQQTEIRILLIEIMSITLARSIIPENKGGSL